MFPLGANICLRYNIDPLGTNIYLYNMDTLGTKYIFEVQMDHLKTL